MKMRILIGSLLLAGNLGTALATGQTVTLAVDNMTCASCPYIVDKALSRVPGVAEAVVSYEAKQATVTFEDTETGVAELIAATTNAGFPSRLLAQPNGTAGMDTD